ncbi:hypothetical protein A8C56_10600 [Niabella ginsenosidivorans]|uniref:D-alanine--D-alanine ligase n=1 Tax=Niabella ginsenosidivorans TaxID=1176587 RepID=A0A1A9I480_9BACT|nr:hypothetical protein [Niabella ginsenosidivorans]ANH81374.1 hypothetical protein A8C56_10600 [Niabella ginsenosidivorans]
MSVRKFFSRIINWELWNFNVIYAPISPVWLWYAIRSRAFWFFTPSNPTIDFGGFEGEGKKEMYDQLPPEFIPRTIYIKHDEAFNKVLHILKQSGFEYPFVVKPDVGMKGILFRVIENEQQLKKYHERIPVEYIVQEKVDYPVEVSVFYYRYPWEKKGVVSGFIHKELLQVEGDGKNTLRQLIAEHPRAKYRLEEMEHRHQHRYERILPRGEVFYLSYAGNHNRGAKFTNLHHHIDDRLVEVFDRLSHYNESFFYGRYDIKTTSIEDLKQGKNFMILEFNGAGAEPNHIYDCNMSLGRAYGVILKHWKVLYRISRYNNRQGVPYWSFRKGRAYLRAAKKHFRLLEQFD